MHAHDFFVNEAAHRHAIEDVAELLPHLDVVATLALIVEAGRGAGQVVNVARIDTCATPWL